MPIIGSNSDFVPVIKEALDVKWVPPTEVEKLIVLLVCITQPTVIENGAKFRANSLDSTFFLPKFQDLNSWSTGLLREDRLI